MQFNPGSKSVPVKAVSFKFYFQKVIGFFLIFPAFIPVDPGFIINIVDYQVWESVIVQIRICSTVRKAWLHESPVLANICKAEVPIIMVRIVVEFYFGNLFEEVRCGYQGEGYIPERNEIVIRNIFGKSIGNDQVAISVIIKICEQGLPTPVCFCHAGIKRNITENWRTDRIATIYPRPL